LGIASATSNNYFAPYVSSKTIVTYLQSRG
jgi:hypothetical protein